MPGVPYAVTSTLYTATGKPVSETDPLGRVTETDYDGAGRKRIERSAVGTAIEQESATYTYYDDDAVRTITDPRGHMLSHLYDGFGRLSVLSYPDGLSESYGYDANDNRTGFTQRDGTVSTTAYDALNRPTGVKRPGLVETVYGLDLLGRVVAEKAGASVVRTYAYDEAGRWKAACILLQRSVWQKAAWGHQLHPPRHLHTRPRISIRCNSAVVEQI